MVGHLGGHADAQVDDLPGAHLGGGAPDHLLPGPAHALLSRARRAKLDDVSWWCGT
jgi:hypothetical protein